MALSGWSGGKLNFTLDQPSANLTNPVVDMYLGSAVGKTDFDASGVFTELGASSLKLAVEHGDTGTECYVEIVNWDNANSRAHLRVQLPSATTSANPELNLYYDSAHADNTTYVGVTGSVVAQNVYDANAAAVYTMSQDPSGGAGSILDSTSTGSTGNPSVTLVTANLIDDDFGGKAIHFNTSGDEVLLSSAIYSTPTALTATILIKALSTDFNYPIEYNQDGVYIRFNINYTVDDGGDIVDGIDCWLWDGSAYKWTNGTTAYTLSSFRAISFRWTGTEIDLFVDGNKIGAAKSATSIAQYGSRPVERRVGDTGLSSGTPNHVIDFVQFDDTNRSDAWISYQADSLKDNLATISDPLNKIMDVAATLPALSVSGTATLHGFFVDITLPALSFSSEMRGGIAGELYATLPSLSFTGTLQSNFSFAAFSLPIFSVSMYSGAETIIELPSLSLSAELVPGANASAKIELPALSIQVTGDATYMAASTISLPSLTVAFGTTFAPLVEMDIDIPMFMVTGNGSYKPEGGDSLAVGLPAFSIKATFENSAGISFSDLRHSRNRYV